MTRNEAKSITNGMLFSWTRSFHKKDDFDDAMRFLSRKKDIVCTFNLIRKKTFLYIPQSGMRGDDCQCKAWPWGFRLVRSPSKVRAESCQLQVQDFEWLSGLWQCWGFSRLRHHMLRKFNATYLSQIGFDSNIKGMELVDLIQGRGKNRACEVYFKDNP